MRAILFLAILAVAGNASAGWTSCPGTLNDSGTALARPTPSQKEICLRQDTATDPPRVDARACRGGVDVIFNSDVASTTMTATAYPYQCPGSGNAGTFTDCEKIMVDRTGDNVVDDVAMNGDPAAAKDATYGISPGWLTFDIANGGSTILELRVVCK